MPWKKLLIYVEGQWDQLFFEKIIKPQFLKTNTYASISVKQWSNLRPIVVSTAVKSFLKDNHDCVITGDRDSTPCITQKRIVLQQKFSLDDYSNIIIVIRKIEHWYSAGISEDVAAKLEIQNWQSGRILEKPDFERNRPQKFDSEVDFRQEILKNFSIEEARKNNKSFDYFFTKYKL